MSLQQNLTNVINTIFIARRQTLTTFAKELDISRCCLNDILNGTANPRLDTVEHIAKNLNIDPQSLLAGPYSMKQLQLLSALLQISSTISKLPDEKRGQFTMLTSELIGIISEN